MAAIAWSDTQPGTLTAASRRQAVILCAEVRNFTRLSEVLEAGIALQQLNRFFQLIGDSCREHGGDLIAVHNDSAVCAFRGGAATQFAQQALRAAQAIQRQFGALEDDWARGYGLRGALAMGLHLGESMFGLAGPFGEERPVVFGDCLTIATRLMQRARAGEFVLSDSVMGALSLSNLDLSADALPPLELSRRPAIGIYGVLLDTRLDFT